MSIVKFSEKYLPARFSAAGFGRGLPLVPVAVLLLAVPLLLQPYRIFQLTGVLSYAVAALGLILITGSIGVVSLSHNAFFALGAYAGALAIIHWDVSYLTSIVIAAVVSFVVGLIAGFPARRLRGLYMALVTLSLAVSVTPIIKQFKQFTGGTAGLFVDRPIAPSWLAMSQDSWIYYLVLCVAVITFFLVRNLVNGSLGRAFAAIREIPLAASSMGIDVSRYKVLVFAVGSMLAGVGGALFNFSIGFLAPDSYALMLAIGFLAAVVVGGLGSIWGALIAGLFLQFVPSLASDISEALSGAIYGGILIVIMLVMPNGVIGTARKIVANRRSAAPQTSSI